MAVLLFVSWVLVNAAVFTSTQHSQDPRTSPDGPTLCALLRECVVGMGWRHREMLLTHSC